ncbi:MAG: lyase family protein [Desulfurococcaceae archaeon]
MVIRYRSFLGESKLPVEKYTSSLEQDKYIAKHIAMVILAHLRSLEAKGLVPKGEELNKLVNILRETIQLNAKNVYEWIEKEGHVFEDFFEAIEAYLYKEVGPLAGYLALGRSRNDHVAAVLRLFTRERVIEVLYKLLELRRIMLEKAIEYQEINMPYFTHRQLAQGGTASIYFLSYEHTFTRIWQLLAASLSLIDENPLGSGPAAGSMIEPDFNKLSETLCLYSEPLPPYFATGSRLFLIYPLSLVTILLTEISRFAEDMLILNATIPEGVKAPLEHIATSSIMPHKKNLVTMEITRANAYKAIGLLTSSLSLYSSLPYGYNLELQEINALLMEAFNKTNDVIDVVSDFIKGIKINGELIEKVLAEKPCWSSELVEELSTREGKPAREIYFEVAKALKNATDYRAVLASLGVDLCHLLKDKYITKHIGELTRRYHISLDDDIQKLNDIVDKVNKCANKLLL